MPVTYSLAKLKTKNYLYACCYCDDDRVRKSIGESISLSDYEGKKFSRTIKGKMADIEKAVDTYEATCRLGRKPFLRADVEEVVQQVINPTKSKRGLKLSDAIDKYISELKKGKLLRKGKKAGASTIYNLEYANIFIRRHTKLAAISIEDFSLKHAQTLLADLNNYTRVSKKVKRNLSKNTITNYFNAVLMFFQFTYKDWHQNPIHKEDGLKQGWDDIDHAISYSVNELITLYRLDFEGNEKKSRDMFVYGSFTGMRISDHNAHSEDNIDNGFIQKGTKKTKNSVAIPLHPICQEILNEYGGNPPQLEGHVFNANIKKVCKKAKGPDGYLFHDKVHYFRTEGGVKDEKEAYRYELTSAHTMRRNFATNATLAGIPAFVVMKMGGWKSYQQFQKYLRATPMDIAAQAAQHPFFKTA